VVRPESSILTDQTDDGGGTRRRSNRASARVGSKVKAFGSAANPRPTPLRQASRFVHSR
jgi:hypothetical protein